MHSEHFIESVFLITSTSKESFSRGRKDFTGREKERERESEKEEKQKHSQFVYEPSTNTRFAFELTIWLSASSFFFAAVNSTKQLKTKRRRFVRHPRKNTA